MKTHLYVNGGYACNARAEGFGYEPSRWLAEHPYIRCKRCERTDEGKALLGSMTPAVKAPEQVEHRVKQPEVSLLMSGSEEADCGCLPLDR